MLVGLLPHLSGLSSLLICTDLEREPVAFRYGAMVTLTLAQHGPTWQASALIGPEMLRPGQHLQQVQ